MKRLILIVLLLLFLPAAAIAETELEACRRLAPKYHAYVDASGSPEYPLADGSRADLVTDTEVFEADWAREKWKEAIGQSLYYSILTGKRPAVLLLVVDPIRDQPHIDRCGMVCEKVGITLYLERAVKDPQTPPRRAILLPRRAR